MWPCLPCVLWDWCVGDISVCMTDVPGADTHTMTRASPLQMPGLSPLPPPPSGGLGTISGNGSVSVTQQPVGEPLMWNLYKRRNIKFYRQSMHLSQTNLVFIISSESKLNPILSNFWCIYLYSSFQLVGSGMFGEDEIILVCCETDSSEGHLIQI